MYSITEKGLEELQRWLSQPARKENRKYEILVKLYFGNQIPPDASIKHTEEFKARNMKNLEMMNLFEEKK